MSFFAKQSYINVCRLFRAKGYLGKEKSADITFYDLPTEEEMEKRFARFIRPENCITSENEKIVISLKTESRVSQSFTILQDSHLGKILNILKKNSETLSLKDLIDISYLRGCIDFDIDNNNITDDMKYIYVKIGLRKIEMYIK